MSHGTPLGEVGGRTGRAMHELLTELYPICRSITGNGVRETLRIIKNHIPLDISNVPTGTFLIDVYLVRDGRIVDAQNMPLVISKVGFGADIYKYANARSITQRFVYGLVAVLVSLLTGWLAHLAFRKR